MLPVGSSWAGALAYCAFTFPMLWAAWFVARDFFFVLIAGFFALYGPVYLYLALRATLDARTFGVMKLRSAAVPAVVGGRFLGSLRISETAAVRGTVRAELRCNLIWYEGGARREETAWAEERSFPIRQQLGGSYAVLEFDIPPGLPASEPSPPAGGAARSQHYPRWEIQAVAESEGAYRDELYAITVRPGQAAAAPEPGALPMEVIRRAAPEAKTAPPAPIVPQPAPPKPRVAKPVAEAQDLAEPEVLPPVRSDPAAVALLVAANLVPLAGVAFWGWQVGQVVFLYWMENLVIGAYNVLRIVALQPKPEDDLPVANAWLGKFFLATFFTVHYGGFCYGHGEFLTSFFGRDADGAYDGVAAMVRHMLREPVVVAALVAMLVSHGWSFFVNYLGRGEYQRVDGGELMTRPYKRIFVTHIFIIVGGFLLTALKSQLLPMLLFIGLKTGFDLYFHRREHRGQSAP